MGVLTVLATRQVEECGDEGNEGEELRERLVVLLDELGGGGLSQ